MSKIPEQAVEAACKAAYNEMDMGNFPDEAVNPKADRDFVRAALEAAAPAMRAEVVELVEAASEVVRIDFGRKHLGRGAVRIRHAIEQRLIRAIANLEARNG